MPGQRPAFGDAEAGGGSVPAEPGKVREGGAVAGPCSPCPTPWGDRDPLSVLGQEAPPLRPARTPGA